MGLYKQFLGKAAWISILHSLVIDGMHSKTVKGNNEQTGCHAREEGYAAFLSSQPPLLRFRFKWRSHRVTDSGNEHRVDALEFTSIPCNLKMQVHATRTVLLVFDSLVKELCDLEKTALTMEEGAYEVILRITNASRVFSSYP